MVFFFLKKDNYGIILYVRCWIDLEVCFVMNRFLDVVVKYMNFDFILDIGNSDNW